jgi:hypothetical protein
MDAAMRRVDPGSKPLCVKGRFVGARERRSTRVEAAGVAFVSGPGSD